MEAQPPEWLSWNWEEIGNNFVQAYYQTFDSNRMNVLAVYHPHALMIYEDNRGMGHQNIKSILEEKIRFSKIQHVVTKVDCQPTWERGILIFVTGRLQTDDDPPHGFSQSFYIRPENNNYFIAHDFFRLSIHNM